MNRLPNREGFQSFVESHFTSRVDYEAWLVVQQDHQGWRQLQSRIRGARTLDVAEWRAATEHEYVDSC